MTKRGRIWILYMVWSLLFFTFWKHGERGRVLSNIAWFEMDYVLSFVHVLSSSKRGRLLSYYLCILCFDDVQIQGHDVVNVLHAICGCMCLDITLNTWYVCWKMLSKLSTRNFDQIVEVQTEKVDVLVHIVEVPGTCNAVHFLTLKRSTFSAK